MFDKIHEWTHSSLMFFFHKIITDSFSLIDTDLFKLSVFLSERGFPTNANGLFSYRLSNL